MLKNVSVPLTRAVPWYPGQFGVRGSDVPLGLRHDPSAVVLYVDYAHPHANDDADGTNPEYPLKTVQAAVDKVARDFDVICVRSINPSGESVVTPLAADAPKGVSLIGAGANMAYPLWVSASESTPCLTLRAQGWRVSGFSFFVPTIAPSVHVLYNAEIGANTLDTIIDHNAFRGDGSVHGLCGILLSGSGQVWIENNAFEMISAAGSGWGIYAEDVDEVPASLSHIVENVFAMCRNGIGGMIAYSEIRGNVFHAISEMVIDTSDGALNLVIGNYLNVSEYTTNTCAGGAGDSWFGNFVPDTTVSEVGDNGITIAPPAAPVP